MSFQKVTTNIYIPKLNRCIPVLTLLSIWAALHCGDGTFYLPGLCDTHFSYFLPTSLSNPQSSRLLLPHLPSCQILGFLIDLSSASFLSHPKFSRMLSHQLQSSQLPSIHQRLPQLLTVLFSVLFCLRSICLAGDFPGWLLWTSNSTCTNRTCDLSPESPPSNAPDKSGCHYNPHRCSNKPPGHHHNASFSQ